MTDKIGSKPNAKAAIAEAHQQIADENQAKAVKLLKAKLRELETANGVVSNIRREIDDLELKIEHGNL